VPSAYRRRLAQQSIQAQPARRHSKPLPLPAIRFEFAVGTWLWVRTGSARVGNKKPRPVSGVGAETDDLQDLPAGTEQDGEHEADQAANDELKEGLHVGAD
jgi:hypothetical protein